MTKWCPGCQQNLSKESFAKSQDYCRTCLSRRRKEQRARLKANPPTPPSEKWCPKCQTKKPAAEFYKSSCKLSGLQDHCKLRQNGNIVDWQHKNPEKTQFQNKKYRQANPEKVKNWDRNAKVKRRRLLAEAEFDSTITLEAVIERDKYTCQLCNEPCSREDASIDHRKPLSKGGNHTWDNIQLAHKRCNSSKKDKYDEREAA
jgi:5-methylcytosine-specific restriction endonuclease McrA